MTHIIREIAAPLVQGTFVFGITYGMGSLFRSPDALQGSVMSTTAFLARYALMKLADSLEERYNWKKSTRCWVKIGFDALTLTAMTIATIALTTIGVLGIILFTSVPLIYIAIDLYQLKKLKEDLPLNERIQKRLEELRNEDSPNQDMIEALERRLAKVDFTVVEVVAGTDG